MSISVESRGQVVVTRLHGYVDKPISIELNELLTTMLDDGATHLVFDFSVTTNIGSDGLKVILAALRRVQQKGGRVVHTGSGDNVRSLLEVTGFLSLLGEFENVEAALAACRPMESGAAA